MIVEQEEVESIVKYVLAELRDRISYSYIYETTPDLSCQVYSRLRKELKALQKVTADE